MQDVISDVNSGNIVDARDADKGFNVILERMIANGLPREAFYEIRHRVFDSVMLQPHTRYILSPFMRI
jgi:hypothetical protein